MPRIGTNLLRYRRRERFTLLVLAMLCVRTLIPAGFMAAPVDGRWELVVCGTALAGSAGSAHHDHANQNHHDVPNCPFALSAGAAPLPAYLQLSAIRVESTEAPPARLAQVVLSFEPARQHQPRGPPRLA